ncbi:phytoene desaturase [Jannaschia sp. Os4]|uniref:1-hydroxycarotenoid 3,4-desaturase CrtD n=1 Tax=Jannaschia sp. Os4 TaxID=2807617 RepID=UPI00193AB21B|nr:1-hydroxycarotenoid 3,4-desaturase CrtD [Jannaschia sp. Os4]MBM2575530.1 phytoene desaturase [Jannaschia sp. Os4]
MPDKVVVIGAGVGGLAAAMRLAHRGADVTVLERHAAPGGKMRVVDSLAGPVDAGPTVLTMRPVFEELFADCGTALDAHVSLHQLDVLATHHWQDGSTLDLYSDYDRSRDAIAAFAGPRAAKQFAKFHRDAERLFTAFEKPMMQSAAPTARQMAGVVAKQPWLVPALAPGRTVAQDLKSRFNDRRLRQLFGRYSTYVGGFPNASPALLSLIWHAESRGVWAVEGGMHALARAMEGVAEAAGATFQYGVEARRIIVEGGRVAGVQIGEARIDADAVVFNGDPRALAEGMLGEAVRDTVPARAVDKRSLSAFVWSFAGRVAEGDRLGHHNVYFGRDADAEFDDIAEGRMPRDPTLYVCAQDRGHGATAGEERFEIIMNAPPRPGLEPDREEMERCRETTFDTLERMGLRWTERPPLDALTTPETFHRMFPGSDGSLYGLSPHGMMAAFRRPRAQTDLPGLTLAGGGAHPGAGIPMAVTSGRLAAEATVRALASTSRSRPTATGGGTSTGSRRTVNAPSR